MSRVALLVMRCMQLVAALFVGLAITGAEAGELPIKNIFVCAILQEKLDYDSAFIVEVSSGRIFEVSYSREIDRVKVRAYRMHSITQYNIRAVVQGRYLGDFLSDPSYDPWPKDRPSTLLSLDRSNGFFMKIFTGSGDFYGPCKVRHEEIADINMKAKEIGQALKRRTLTP